MRRSESKHRDPAWISSRLAPPASACRRQLLECGSGLRARLWVTPRRPLRQDRSSPSPKAGQRRQEKTKARDGDAFSWGAHFWREAMSTQRLSVARGRSLAKVRAAICVMAVPQSPQAKPNLFRCSRVCGNWSGAAMRKRQANATGSCGAREAVFHETRWRSGGLPILHRPVVVRSYRYRGLSPCILNWSRLSGQKFRVDKWSLCRG